MQESDKEQARGENRGAVLVTNGKALTRQREGAKVRP
jgi:hypothetical protein